MTELLTTTPQEEKLEPALNQDHELEPAKTVKIMERLHAAEIFGTPEQSKAFLDSLDYEGFKKYISFVNGVERGIPTTERGKVSDSYVQSDIGIMGTRVEYRPPHATFRDDLLKSAFEKAKELDDPEMAALTLGLSINAIHYFADGNGRTARMTYALLAKGYDGSPEAQEYYSSLLENTKGREIVNPNPAESGIDRTIRSELFEEVNERSGYGEAFGDKVPMHVFDGYPDAFVGEESPEYLAIADDIDAEGRAMLHYTLQSGGMEMISLMAAFKPDRVKDFVRAFDHTPDKFFVDGNKFLPTLSKEEIVAWWRKAERAIKVYVHRLIKVAEREDAREIATHYRK